MLLDHSSTLVREHSLNLAIEAKRAFSFFSFLLRVIERFVW